MVIISEEAANRGETLPDIIKRIADLVVKRGNAGKNFGTVLIPEGLLSHISAYKHLIEELSEVMVDGRTAPNQLEIPTGNYVHTHNHSFGELRNAHLVDLKAHFGIHSL
jgi:6-phosphofructokinase